MKTIFCSFLSRNSLPWKAAWLGVLLFGTLTAVAEVQHDVHFELSQWGINEVTNRKVLIKPLFLNAPAGTLAPEDAWMFISDASGGFWITNMLSGTYHGEIEAPPTRTPFDFYVDTTNATQQAGDHLIEIPDTVSLQFFYTAAQTDAAISNALAGAESNFTASATNLSANAPANGALLSYRTAVSSTRAYWTTNLIFNGGSLLLLSNTTPMISLSTTGTITAAGASIPGVAQTTISNHFTADQFMGGKIYGTGIVINCSTGTLSTVAHGVVFDVLNGWLKSSDSNLVESLNNRSLYSNGVPVVVWDHGFLNDNLGDISVDWNDHYLYSGDGTVAVDWGGRQFLDVDGLICAGWVEGHFRDANNFPFLSSNDALEATNLVDRTLHTTPPADGVKIDGTRESQLFVTNATCTVSGFSGLVNGYLNAFEMTVSNSSASSITWNGPANAFYFGSGSSGSVAIPAGKEAWMQFRVWPGLRTNIQNNNVQQ